MSSCEHRDRTDRNIRKATIALYRRNMGDFNWRYDIADLAEVFSGIDPFPVGDDGVAAIDYTVEFRTAFGYLQALIGKDERSERALRLTATCLQLNPGNYTVWQYRRRCLDMTNPSVIAKDLALTTNLGGANPKNYQIWHHRRALLDHHFTDASVREELGYISSVLSHDSKNYHAWSHRLWVVGKSASLWDDELISVDSMIHDDARNNSAWNYRWFLLHHGTKHTLTPAQALQEIDYVTASIEADGYNESTWRFLVALTKEQASTLVDGSLFLGFVDMLLDRLRKLREELKTDNHHYMGTMVDILEMKADHISLTEAKCVCEALAQRNDAVRASYWEKRLHVITLRHESDHNLN